MRRGRNADFWDLVVMIIKCLLVLEINDSNKTLPNKACFVPLENLWESDLGVT